jgi:DNA polymerase-3 subunit beta
MIVTALRADILAALEKCAHAGGTAGGKPHAGKTRLKATSVAGGDTDVLTFYANDLSVSIDTATAAAVEVEGIVGIDTKRLHAVVTALPEGTISLAITPKGRQLSVTAKGHRKYGLPVVGAEVFPTPPEPPEDAARAALPAAKLSYLLTRVGHAMSSDEHDQIHLRGVKLEVADQIAFAVATDGHRFAKAETPLPDAQDMELFLPRNLHKLIVGQFEDEDLAVGSDGRMVFIETEDTLVCSMMPPPGFPPRRKLMESMHAEPAVHVPRITLLETLKAVLAARSAEASKLKETAVLLRYAEPYEYIEVQLAKDEADAVDRVAVTDGHPRPFELAYDPRYLIDAVRAAEANLLFRVVDMGDLCALTMETDEKFFAWVAPRKV